MFGGDKNKNVMKRKLKIRNLFFILSFMLLPFGEVNADEPQACITVRIVCENGNVAYYNGCGSAKVLAEELDLVIRYHCGN